MFETTTVKFEGMAPQRKPFTWTYSKLKNFRSCPKRHYHYEIAKLLGDMDNAIREDESKELKLGNELHKAMAQRVSKGIPLPTAFRVYEEYAQAFLERANRLPNPVILVEQKWAINRDYQLVGYFAKDVWFRQTLDAVAISKEAGIGLQWDWKTGKPKNDPLQLLLGAAMLFTQYPELDGMLNEFVWLQHGSRTTARLMRADVPQLWAAVLPEVQKMEHAYNNVMYPAQPNALCGNWCQVESCPHHGL